MLTAVLVARAWGCSLVPNTRMEVHLCVGFHFVKCDLLAVLQSFCSVLLSAVDLRHLCTALYVSRYSKYPIKITVCTQNTVGPY